MVSTCHLVIYFISPFGRHQLQ